KRFRFTYSIPFRAGAYRYDFIGYGCGNRGLGAAIGQSPPHQTRHDARVADGENEIGVASTPLSYRCNRNVAIERSRRRKAVASTPLSYRPNRNVEGRSKNNKKMKGYMYILLCSDGSYYTGSTVDLNMRIAQHFAGEGAN